MDVRRGDKIDRYGAVTPVWRRKRRPSGAYMHGRAGVVRNGARLGSSAEAGRSYPFNRKNWGETGIWRTEEVEESELDAGRDIWRVNDEE